MKHSTFKRNSIMKKIMWPMMLVLLVQSGLFLGAIFYGGTILQLNENAFDILNERVINRKNYLQNEMTQRWTSVNSTVVKINHTVETTVKAHGVDYRALSSGEPVTNEVLGAVSEDLIGLLRRQGVTGVFLVLDGAGDVPENGELVKAGLYLSDLDPRTSLADNSDLLVERSPTSILRQMELTMDTNWQPHFTFSTDAAQSGADFYFKPMQAARDYPGLTYSDLAYWSRPFALDENTASSLSYSVPLIGRDGLPYGVLGVSITSEQLRRMLPYQELSEGTETAYVLGVSREESSRFDAAFVSGPSFPLLVDGGEDIHIFPEPEHGSVYRFSNDNGEPLPVLGSVQYLNLYNSNTPFSGDRWALIGLASEKELLRFSHGVERSILLAVLISLLLGLLGVGITSRLFTRPVTALVQKVKQIDPHLPVRFDKIHIDEIDELAASIELLSRNVADSASKLSQIIEMSSTPIGAFECRSDSTQVFYTQRLFELLGIDCPVRGDYVERTLFDQLMKTLDTSLDPAFENSGGVQVYQITEESGANRWVRMKIISNDARILGVAEDITQETLEKRKIEYERDYDLLTNLLNRRAFHATMAALFRQPKRLKTGALIMLDLDNLKYINDTYGHDYGDQYIRCMARILKKHTPRESVLSRISGDEFLVFLYGCDNREQIRALVADIRTGMRGTLFALPNDPTFRVRASAGVAWYPDDSDTPETLIRYADFAMYKVKNTVKGEFEEFDPQSYQRDAYLLHGREDLNRLLEEELVEYHFQPIVDARTGKIFAYEALMRSLLENLKSPLEVLTLARSQSKLYQVERMTLFLSLQYFRTFDALTRGCRLFVNSIASQMLSEQDVAAFEAENADYLSRIVIEMTEEEKLNEDFAQIKQEIIQRWGAALALDDYGSGYNGDSALLMLSPSYVKIDMSIVRNIDRDENRLKLLQNLISYTHGRKIQVIAEGVETQGELETLVRNGVDYLQGYFLGRPSREPRQVDAAAAAVLTALATERGKEAIHKAMP